MSSPRIWIAAGALACLALVGIYAYRTHHDGGGGAHGVTPATPGASASGGSAGVASGGALAPNASGSSAAGDPLGTSDGRQAGASGSSAGVANGTGSTASTGAPSGTGAIAPPKSGPGAMPYRPANVLRWSASPPASGRSGDLASPVLQRVLEVAKPDDAQKQKIIDLWTEHEDQRRAILAAAPQRASGPPIPDARKTAENDFKFESTLLSRVLRRDQMDRLVPEIYPPKPPKR